MPRLLQVLAQHSGKLVNFTQKEMVKVDFVLEIHAGEIVGIEVKAGSTIFNQDFRGLKK